MFAVSIIVWGQVCTYICTWHIKDVLEQTRIRIGLTRPQNSHQQLRVHTLKLNTQNKVNHGGGKSGHIREKGLTKKKYSWSNFKSTVTFSMYNTRVTSVCSGMKAACLFSLWPLAQSENHPVCLSCPSSPFLWHHVIWPMRQPGGGCVFLHSIPTLSHNSLIQTLRLNSWQVVFV